MQARSIDLLKKAEDQWEKEGRSYADVCQEIGVNRTALTKAKELQRLSPVIAGRLAQMLGVDATKWIALAAIENAKNSKARTVLEKHLRAVTSVGL